jgi:hypothetical protein
VSQRPDSRVAAERNDAVGVDDSARSKRTVNIQVAPLDTLIVGLTIDPPVPIFAKETAPVASEAAGLATGRFSLRLHFV